jgi:hypothetical protein
MTIQIAPIIEGLISIDSSRARIQVGNLEVAYHCDKFATRITKGLEDILGVDKASTLLADSAARTAFRMLNELTATLPEWGGLSTAEKLGVIFDAYKVLGDGSVQTGYTGGSSAQVTSPTSYLAEGYLENMQRWQWPLRKDHYCHELCGLIQAAFAVALGKDLAAIRVAETECRTTGAGQCEFAVEVG